MRVLLTTDVKKSYAGHKDIKKVKVVFEESDKNFHKDSCDWLPTFEELLRIIHFIFESEDLKYPRDKGFLGREMFFNEIVKVYKKEEFKCN